MLSAVAGEAQAEGGPDLDVRMANLKTLHRLVAQRREATEEALRLPGRWSPVTWWANPITGQRTALNATSDGRLDLQVVAQIRASLDLDIVVAMARDRAAQEAPLSPAERVARDIENLK
jgi:hypothetical protein